MLYNPLIKSKGQIAIVSEQTGMMTVSDFFNLDWEKKNQNTPAKTEEPLCQTQWLKILFGSQKSSCASTMLIK